MDDAKAALRLFGALLVGITIWLLIYWAVSPAIFDALATQDTPHEQR